MFEVTTDWYLTLAAILFSIGFFGMMIRKNALIMFMCIELMLNAVNLTFIAASKHFGQIDGQIAVFFVLVVAAAEVVVGLAIIVSIFRKQKRKLCLCFLRFLESLGCGQPISIPAASQSSQSQF